MISKTVECRYMHQSLRQFKIIYGNQGFYDLILQDYCRKCHRTMK